MDVLLPAFGGSKPPLRCAWVGAQAIAPHVQTLLRQIQAAAPLRVGWSGGLEPPFLPKMRGVVQEHTSHPLCTHRVSRMINCGQRVRRYS
jgi:hypothetical protein